MLAMDTIRNWQYQVMEQGLQTLTSIVNNHPDDQLTTYKDGGDGWTVLQVMCHLRDFEDVFYGRIKGMVTDDNPALPFPDPDEQAAENAYHEDNIHAVLATLTKTRREFIEYMKSLGESDWEQTGIHPTRGTFTPHDQLFLNTLHDSIHLEQITRILAEKKA